MADPVNYSGVTYDDAYYRQDQESMYDYMKRLASQRAGGVLGGGGMLNTPQSEITSTDLGTVKENCAAGYVWDGKACVPVQQSGGGDGASIPQVSNEERIKGIRHLLDNPEQRMLLQAVVPAGGLLFREGALEGALRNDQNEATGSQGFLNYLRGKDGDVVLGDKGTGTGSLVTGMPTSEDQLRAEFQKTINATPMLSNIFNPATAYPATMPQLPTVQQSMLSPEATALVAESYALTGSGSGSSSDPYSGGWSADDTSSWDTSGGGTNADGSYDISGWFSG